MHEEERQPEGAVEMQAELEADEAADLAVKHALGEGVPLVGVPDVAEAVESEPAESEEQAEEMAGPQLDEPELAVPGVDRLVLERKHPLAIRWMHWVNFPVLFTMIWSGILIYWNDSDNAFRHAHEVYRVGLGPVTVFRFFPAWFYTNRFWDMRYRVTEALGYHFFFMWIFAINGIAYVAFLLWSKEWKFMLPTRASLAEAIQVTLVDLHLRKGLPAQTKYNGAQRIAYTSVIVMGLGSLVTGLAIYKPTQAHWLTSLLGGYEMARWLHFWLTMGFCGFFLVHVGQVMLAGWNNFRSMVSGYELRPANEPSLEAERRRF
jgi:thiosulfate reductase cytochrome b subunit